jgi:hypothetical protein
MDVDDVQIRITEDFTHEEGWLFWKGETFYVCGGNVTDSAEVKTAGEYIDLPASIYEVVT